MKELIIGIEINEEYAQLTYYHQSVREPVTLGNGGPAEQMQIPMALQKSSRGLWSFPKEKPEETEDETALRVDDIFRRTADSDTVDGGAEQVTAAELWTVYFRLCLERLKLLTENSRIHVMVTVRELTKRWSSLLVQALEANHIERRRIYLQDYFSAFYYYAVNQKREYWYQDVALLEYQDNQICGYVLHIDRTTRPAMARVNFVASQRMDDSVRAGLGEKEWKKEKDRLFFELLKKVFERRTIAVSYLVGDYFSKDWAEKSIQYLCYKRHAFQGQNLYSKGACYAAMERAGLIPGRDVIFGGQDMIEHNIGMEMRVRGKDTFYPMITAGINWYEAHHTCEFILNGEREVRVISHPMSQGESIVHMMRLPGMPARPDRGTRVRMTIYFSSPQVCHLEVEDLGFGGLFKSSGMVWSRTLNF